MQSRGEALADRTAPAVLAAGALSLPFVGGGGATALLFVGVGDSIRLTAPLSVLNALDLAARSGMLIKDGRFLELLARVDTVVFDKTGTLTEEVPTVRGVHALDGVAFDEIVRLAAIAEHRQDHPIAQAIVREAGRRGIEAPSPGLASVEAGMGLTVRFDGASIRIGSGRFMAASAIPMPPGASRWIAEADARAGSLTFVALDGRLMGAIELEPTVRADAGEVVARLQAAGLDVMVLSGDREPPTRALARRLGITRWYSQTLPTGKAERIAALQAEGRSVCFVGDGINDTIAMKQAQVAVSLAGASTIAVDTAGVVMLDGRLGRLPEAFDIARRLERNMGGNYLASLLPAAAIVGGVFALRMGVLGTIVIYNAGLALGVANAASLARRRPADADPAPPDGGAG